MIGGSNLTETHSKEVYSKNVDDPHGSWTKMPDLLDARRYHGCVATRMDGKNGILVIGGHGPTRTNDNGVMIWGWTMQSIFLALEDSSGQSLEIYGENRNMPRWEYVADLTKVRKVSR